MKRPAIRRLIAITAMAWLSTPLCAGEIIELKIPRPGEASEGRQDTESRDDRKTTAPFMTPSRLNVQNPSPSLGMSDRNGSDMQKHINEQFLATTRALWLDREESES